MEKTVASILIIDDHGDNLVSLKAMISDLFSGICIYTAASGPEGIALAKAHQPDVILLDIQMPGMDGFSVCKIIKDDNNLCDIPVVFITALRENSADKVHALEVGDEKKAIEAWCIDYISKPFEKDNLLALIKKHLRK